MNFAPDEIERRYSYRVRVLAARFDWPAVQALRAEIRQAHSDRYSIQFNEALCAAELLGVTWPPPFGGGAGPVEYFLLREAIEVQGLPAYGFTQQTFPGAMLIRNGSQELIAEHLPHILDGSWRYCSGLSEPGAGSDLLALRTTAIRDPDGYLVNGTKLWTSAAHLAKWCSVVCRTDPSQTRSRGLSVIMVDLESPGVSIRPVHVMGGWQVNEVSFHDVRVPVRNRVGEENDGWQVLAASLDEERSMSFGGTETRALLARIIHRLEGRADIAEADMEELGGFILDAEVDRLLNMRVALLMSRGDDASAAGPISKVHGSELAQRFAQWAVDLVGQDALYGEGRGDVLAGDLEQELRVATVLSIIGGTNEIQRNTIASRLLHLPKAT
jgi:alkylation response protein AidB-like acyl-CoA dehydrogenase